MDNKFIYGLARLRKGDKTMGYIEKGSWDWGGTKPEPADVFAEQVASAAVLTLPSTGGTISPTFNLIQLDYETFHDTLGGELVGSEGNYTGWKAPTDTVMLTDRWAVDFVSGQTMTIPNGTILANLGGKLTLSEVSKLECQLKVNMPSDGSAPYEINDTVES